MTTSRPCPLCGSESNPKFDRSSDWCSECASMELLDQQLEDTDELFPEITPPLGGAVRIEHP
jgi:hypothetical protein